MESIIRYRPILFLTLHLDAEWSRNRQPAEGSEPGPFSQLLLRIRRLFKDYKSSVEKVNKLFAPASPIDLPACLYNPIFCYPSGHSDAMAFALVDDFDAVYHIAAHSRTIEQISLAFVPEPPASSGVFQYSPVEAHWENLFALTSICKLKLDGLAILEYLLRFRRAVLLSAADRLGELWRLDSFDKTAEFIVTPLVLQGQEEAGFLISANSASVIAAVTSALRSLSFADCRNAICAGDDQPEPWANKTPAGANGYSHGELHRRIFSRGSEPDHQFPAFRWSTTAIGFRMATDLHPFAGTGTIAGNVFVDFDIELAPGLRCHLEHLPRLESSESATGEDIAAEFGDYDFQSRAFNTRQLIVASGFLESLQAFTDVLGRNGKESCAVVGFSTRIAAPVKPDCYFHHKLGPNRSPLDEALQSLGFKNREGAPAHGTHLDLSALFSCPKAYSMPRSLRRSIESLFQQFLSAVVNPNHFDLVIDLYDAFCSFHCALTETLPEAFRNGFRLGADVVAVLARFTSALQSAVSLRLESTKRSGKFEVFSSQFPGSFAQILFAADAPIKVGLGILKYYLPHRKPKSIPDRLAELNIAGVVCEVSLDPGIRVFDVRVPPGPPKPGPPGTGTVKGVPRLSFLSLDMDHLFHAGSFYDYLHETLHFSFDEMVVLEHHPEGKSINLRLALENEETRERVEEVCVNMLCFKFLSASSPTDILHYLIGKYSLDVVSVGQTESECVRKFAERLVTIAIPAWLCSGQGPSQKGGEFPELDSFLTFLHEQLPLVFPLFYETSRLDMEELRGIFKAHAVEFWLTSGMDFYVAAGWKMATDVHLNLASEHDGIGFQSSKRYDAVLNKLQDGWAVSRVNTTQRDQIDGVAACAILLGKYLTRFGPLDPDKHLRYHTDRDPETGNLINVPGVNYSPFLMDRGSAQSFAVTGKARQDRLSFQIAMLESFSDISSHFRARRVYDFVFRAAEKSKGDPEAVQAEG